MVVVSLKFFKLKLSDTQLTISSVTDLSFASLFEQVEQVIQRIEPASPFSKNI